MKGCIYFETPSVCVCVWAYIYIYIYTQQYYIWMDVSVTYEVIKMACQVIPLHGIFEDNHLYVYVSAQTILKTFFLNQESVQILTSRVS